MFRPTFKFTHINLIFIFFNIDKNLIWGPDTKRLVNWFWTSVGQSETTRHLPEHPFTPTFPLSSLRLLRLLGVYSIPLRTSYRAEGQTNNLLDPGSRTRWSRRRILSNREALSPTFYFSRLVYYRSQGKSIFAHDKKLTITSVSRTFHCPSVSRNSLSCSS